MKSITVILTMMSAAAACAQITDPNQLIAPPPPPIQFRGKHLIKPNTDFQWLWQYTQPTPNGNEGALLSDPHFVPMLQENLKAPQSFFRDGAVPLSEVVRQYFGVNFADKGVRATENRYVSLTGCVPHQCENQGLLWVDTSVQRPLVVFAATQWTTQGAPIEDPKAEFNLWLFASRAFDAEHPPVALVTAIAQWNSRQHIHAALVIDPDGTPHQINPAALGATPAVK